ncbi:MAG: arylsulfatase A-like enzyme [Planctomycetota bacterium]
MACHSETRAASKAVPEGTPVFLIVIDTLRADHLGCYGYERDTSPELDAFAKQASLFETATAQANSTFPSLTSILTGLYLKTHRNYVAVPIEGLAADNDRVRSLAERFEEAGYQRLAVFSHPSWSGGPSRSIISRAWTEMSIIDPDLAPEDRVRLTRGTDTNARAFPMLDSYLKSASDPVFCWLHYFEPHTDKWPNVYDANPATRNLYLESHLREYGLERHAAALREIEPEERPAWILAHIEPQHQSRAALANGRSLYDAEIRSCDAAISEFFDFLRARGLFDRLLIAVLADHGENMEAGEESGGDAVRGASAFSHEKLYDGVALTPFLLKLPGQTRGLTHSALVQNIDLAPTLIELLDLPEDSQIEGESLVGVLSGEAGEVHEFVYIESTDYVEKAVRD